MARCDVRSKINVMSLVHSQSNLDLFSDSSTTVLAEYRDAMAGWLAEAGRSGRLQRESSSEVYEHKG